MAFNSHDIPVSKAVLDSSDSVVRKIEAINLAIIELIRSYPDSKDPVLATLMGTDSETMTAIAQAPKATLTKLVMTGVPVFGIRIASSDFVSMINSNENPDALFKNILRTFEGEVHLRSL